jgi:hypothetical protein
MSILDERPNCSIPEAAELAGVSVPRMRALVKAGAVASFVAGPHTVRVVCRSLAAFLDGQTTSAERRCA